MLKSEAMAYKRFAKKGCKDHGIRVNIKDMILLETGCSRDGILYFAGNKEMYVNYVMFEDFKTGKQFQVRYGVNRYDCEINTLYAVDEYIPF